MDHRFAVNVDHPEDWPERQRLPSRDTSPSYCGEHAPGFTGAYAVINSLKLLLSEAAPLQQT